MGYISVEEWTYSRFIVLVELLNFETRYGWTLMRLAYLIRSHLLPGYYLVVKQSVTMETCTDL